MLKKIKNIVKYLDLFSQPATFRFAEEPNYTSLTGGVCSLVLIITFTIIFFNTVLSTINRERITSNLTKFEEVNPSYHRVGTDLFMFAIGLRDIDLSRGPRWFDFNFTSQLYKKANRTYQQLHLKPCSRKQWARISQQMGNLYDNLGFAQWLCPPEDLSLEMQGKYTSEIFKFYKIAATKCNPALDSDRPCVSQQDIRSFLEAQQSFTFNFYYVNTVLNPDNQEFVSTYLDDFNYFNFAPDVGISANLFISAYEINTDYSIYPVEDNQQVKGGIVLSPAQTVPFKATRPEYLKFYLRKSSLSLMVGRSFMKIDDTLSYIGGLMSAILACLILVHKYNENSYELEIAQNLYHYDKNEPLKSKQFNFVTYLGFQFYEVLYAFGIKLRWKKMNKYRKSLEEIRKQMDIRLVMKKILYSERMSMATLEDHKASLLHLQQPLTLEEAEQIRQEHRLYQKIACCYFDYEQIRQQEKRRSQQLQSLGHAISNQAIEVHEAVTQFQEEEMMPKTSTAAIRNKRNAVYPEIHSEAVSCDNGQCKAQAMNKLYLRPKVDIQPQQKQYLQKCFDRIRSYVSILRAQKARGDRVSSRILENLDSKLLELLKIPSEFEISFLGQQLSEEARKEQDSSLEQPEQTKYIIRVEKPQLSRPQSSPNVFDPDNLNQAIEQHSGQA